MNGRTLLDVRGLTKVYRARRRGGVEVRANHSITLSVREGEVVAILGPNGAGKSTFLKQLAGQLLPTSGSIRVGGVDMVARPQLAKRALSVIPQECTPYEALTVEEHVRYFGIIKGMDPSKATEQTHEILGKVGLMEHRSKITRELSGGLKRRVLIAVALAGPDVRLLLLDEPTTGLDPEARREVWRVVAGLRSSGHGILLTTHYIDEADVLADRIVIIARGQVLAEGTPAEILARVRAQGRLDIYGVDRLAAEGRRAVGELRARWPVAFEREDRLRLSIPDPFSPDSVRELSRLAGLGVQASLAPASLEDAYLAVTGEAPEGA